ncbi:MAG: PD-(D/E)XK nuclease family protein, partial [Gemmatimonadetes bacterium]|nr:PD-(D/E)XK nuclease family protein [Gemmatimonadota bacterium]
EERIETSRVLTPGLPLALEEHAYAHAQRVARIERVRQTGVPTRWNGLIEDPVLVEWLAREFGDERVWSATQLESYAKCPWAFFSERLLHLEKLEDPDEEMDPLVRGTVLHDALRRFYESARARVGGPVLLRPPDRAWAEAMLLDCLDAALESAAETEWMGNPALRGAKREELRRMLRRYLEWETGENEKLFTGRGRARQRLCTGVVEHELQFDDVVLETAGVRVRFRGFIDRVEVGVDTRVPDADGYVAAVDYKTSKAGAPGGGEKEAWEDDVVLQVPLYAYALERLRPGARAARVEYRAVKQHEAVHALELVRVVGIGAEEDEEAREKMERALEAVGEHVLAMRAGVFPARPAPSCGCPPFCHAWDICRVKGGPRRKE